MAVSNVAILNVARSNVAISDVIVTGTAQGIGRTVAETLARRPGVALLLADIQAEKVAAVAAGLGGESVAVDISDPDSCRAMVAAAVETLGGVDAVVQIAGLDAPPGTALTTDDDLWRLVIGVNGLGVSAARESSQR